ncbi:MAG: hydroxyacid dehydrogenase [Phreatobacter sp.]|uniref:hydroxyacid dehydrogenase n=1 Tax=Phreatobacter sp. TaxID=1966341 RepID=UPI001A621AEA|nr:hydroxyacid dehydrogenase [Phreatobacter sp.]MBL8571832.1 hydroxyacid dehydrogenase [Phreatobacter sp.]
MVDIVITEFMDESAIEDLRRDFTVHYDRDLAKRPEAIMEIAADAPALVVRNVTQVRGALLAALPNLKVVGRLGVGLDNIDVEECARRGIKVFPATGANTVSVAEYVIAAMLVAARDVWRASEAVLEGAWPRNDLMLGEVAGKRLGLIGFGAIARAVADRARALDVDIVASDPVVAADDPAWSRHGAARVELDALLRTSDFVSIHAPLVDSTRNLLDAARLAVMKPGAVVINTARGGIVDEAALAAALKAGRLGGAVLDVFDREPLAAGSPLVGAPRLRVTPHIAGVTREANSRVSTVTAHHVRNALRGNR